MGIKISSFRDSYTSWEEWRIFEILECNGDEESAEKEKNGHEEYVRIMITARPLQGPIVGLYNLKSFGKLIFIDCHKLHYGGDALSKGDVGELRPNGESSCILTGNAVAVEICRSGSILIERISFLYPHHILHGLSSESNQATNQNRLNPHFIWE